VVRDGQLLTLLTCECASRPTTACTFSTFQRPIVVRDGQFLTILTCQCASRHNRAHFFDISTSEHEVFPTFWLQNVLWATAMCIFWCLIRPDGSAPAALASLLLDSPGPLCFSFCPDCRKFMEFCLLNSKLPSFGYLMLYIRIFIGCKSLFRADVVLISVNFLDL